MYHHYYILTHKKTSMQRRKFVHSIALGGIGIALAPIVKAAAPEKSIAVKPTSNIQDALNIPRTNLSMPGKFPGKVVKVNHPDCFINGKPSNDIAYEMVKTSMQKLTEKENLNEAWLQFVDPKDIIGLKVNPIGGKLLSTSHAVTKAVIKQLTEAGIPKANIIIWDRRGEDLDNAEFTAENYPGIKIMSTEYKDAKGNLTDENGKFYSENEVDKNQYFYVDVDGVYDKETMPYMTNGGKNSYFTKICTEKVTKIINIPIIKNAGASITVCMKNLAFGSITNTGRLHQAMWHETCAYACAFPPIRDKVVLNIADGLVSNFDGGPGADPQFIYHANTLVVGTDAVAVDRICYDIVLNKRIKEGVQQKEKEGARIFMDIAQKLNLGIADKANIKLEEINLNV